eukprot:XP_013996717.1 PREDICTED: fibronectin type III domain-containing protein 7-like [Salmo salar]
MEKLGTLYLPFILLSLTQIQHALAACSITSITSPSASTLDVKWNSYPGATNYFLDLRVVNSISIAPVVVTLPVSSTQRLIQGLRPGSVYQVQLKVFQFYYVMCTNTQIATTVPATSQITYSKAISSTSIRFQWSGVTGADKYLLVVDGLSNGDRYNYSFTTLTGQVDGLTPAKSYNCYVYSSNQAGLGTSSTTKTITTLVQPPAGVAVVATGRSSARVTWQTVNKVLLYQVSITDSNKPSVPVLKNTTTTYMDVSNLQPCSTYIVGVSSVNAFLEPGEPTNVSHITSSEYCWKRGNEIK